MKKLLLWTSAIGVICVVFGTIYGVAQQAQRNQANDPQIQMAQDAAAALNQGITPTSLTQSHVDMAASLAPFTIIYTMQGNVVSGSGYLGSSVPTIPQGVLNAADNQSFNAVTWQPQSGVRIAAVAVKADHYYVVAGRSLTEVEKRENKTMQLTVTGLLLSLLVVVCAFTYVQRRAMAPVTGSTKRKK